MKNSIALLILFNILLSIIINKTNVPADLRSAGIKYKDLFNPLKIPLFYESKERKVGLAQLKVKNLNV